MNKRPVLLVVDDQVENREAVADSLEDDYDIAQAANGKQAIEHIERARPDLLILDLGMPVIDGFGVLQFLADHPSGFLPVIVVSALGDRESRLRALRMGAHEFLAKPFDPEEIVVRVRTMLALKEAREMAERRAEDLEDLVAERTRELRAANEELRQVDRYKDEFLSVITHELRTPLTFILGFASILGDEGEGRLNAAQHRAVDRILEGTDRLGKLIDNLLDMGRMAAGQFHVDPHEVLVGPLVDEALGSMRSLALEKEIELAADVRVAGPLMLDRRTILQVFTNLIDNALKFTGKGGKVRVRAELRDGTLVAEVEDTGSGIASEDIPRLFKQFKQLDMKSTRKVGGAGLGLSIAKGIVHAHGGEIGVRSNPGDGSTFWFSLPARPPGGLNTSIQA